MQTSTPKKMQFGQVSISRRGATVHQNHPKYDRSRHWEDLVATVSLALLATILVVLLYQAMVP